MRKGLAVLAVLSLVVALAPVSAADDGPETGGTYLALGDSIGAGTEQPLPFTPGYTRRLYRHLRDTYGFDNFVNLSCPGDDTVEMRFGTSTTDPFGSACYGPNAVLPPYGGPSQLDRAVEYLTNPDNPEVRLITIVQGANDILACDLADPDAAVCLGGQFGQIVDNLPVIVGTLQAVAPDVPIVAMNYYDPFLAWWITGPEGQALAEASLGVIGALNDTVEAVYGVFGVPVADVETAFGTFRTRGAVYPTNVRRVCKFTKMCEKAGSALVLSDYDPDTEGPQTDIHPSQPGYRRIATTHAELIDFLGLFG